MIAPVSKPGEGVDWTPTRSEPLPIPVTCDFHSWMKAYWLILEHPYAAITDEHGRFRIPGLPSGRHEFRVWHERVGWIERKYEVMVIEGKTIPLKPLSVKGSRFTSDE